MDLKSGRPVWLLENPGPMPEYPDLAESLACDVAVIGAGITGALAAYHLVCAGLDVVVLDGRPAGRGSTVASTALIQYEIDTPLTELRTMVGRDHADRAYRSSLGAVRRLGALMDELGDGCGYERRRSLYLASRSSDVATLRDEFAARSEVGIDVELLCEADLAREYGIARPAALRSADAAQIDPFRLTHRLIAAAVDRGARVHTGPGALVRSFSTGNPMELVAEGGSVSAGSVLFASGYESQSYLSPSVATMKSTYAIATAPQPSFGHWTDRCLIWETGRPYLYMRTTPGGRVVIGGADEDTSDAGHRDRLLPKKVRTLKAAGTELFPEIDFTAESAWAGTFAETKDGLPYIGKPLGDPDIWFALGYGGNGITFSLLAAEIVRDALTGRPNEDAPLYRFDR